MDNYGTQELIERPLQAETKSLIQIAFDDLEDNIAKYQQLNNELKDKVEAVSNVEEACEQENGISTGGQTDFERKIRMLSARLSEENDRLQTTINLIAL